MIKPNKINFKFYMIFSVSLHTLIVNADYIAKEIWNGNQNTPYIAYLYVNKKSFCDVMRLK